MKYTLFLVLLMLSPFANLFAQKYDPDSLEVLSEQQIKDLNSGKAVVEESTVMEMLDLVSNLTVFNDAYLDIDTAVWNKYGFRKDEVPTYDDSVYMRRIQTLAYETTVPLTFNSHVKSFIELYAHRRRQRMAAESGPCTRGGKGIRHPACGLTALKTNIFGEKYLDIMITKRNFIS